MARAFESLFLFRSGKMAYSGQSHRGNGFQQAWQAHRTQAQDNLMVLRNEESDQGAGSDPTIADPVLPVDLDHKDASDLKRPRTGTI